MVEVRTPAPLRGLLVLVLSFACCVSAAEAAVFPLSQPEIVPGTPGEVIDVLDFDADGFNDIASAKGQNGIDGGDVRLLRGTDSGWAAEQGVTVAGVGGTQTAIAAADVTGDGRDDILATFGDTGSLVVLRGNPGGALATPAAADVYSIAPTVPGGRTTGVDWGDIDGDGDLDVVTVVGRAPAEPGQLTVFVNDGAGALTATGQALAVDGPVDVLLLALGGADDDLDIVVAQDPLLSTMAVRVFPGATGATFAAPADVAAGEPAHRLAWGDFDSDGRIDVAVSHRNGPPLPTTILKGTAAAPGLGAAFDIDSAVEGREITVGDLDRDGRDDLLVADALQNTINAPTLLSSRGSFTFERIDALRAGPPGQAGPRVGDMDGDGRPDLVTSGSRTGAGPDAYVIQYGLGAQLTVSSILADFNAVAVGSRSETRTIEWLNEGPGAAAAIEVLGEGNVEEFPVESDACTGATLGSAPPARCGSRSPRRCRAAAMPRYASSPQARSRSRR